MSNGIEGDLFIGNFQNIDEKQKIFTELSEIIKNNYLSDPIGIMPDWDNYIKNSLSELKKKEWFRYLSTIMEFQVKEFSDKVINIKYDDWKISNGKELLNLTKAYPELVFFVKQRVNYEYPNESFVSFTEFKNGKKIYGIRFDSFWAPFININLDRFFQNDYK